MPFIDYASCDRALVIPLGLFSRYYSLNSIVALERLRMEGEDPFSAGRLGNLNP